MMWRPRGLRVGKMRYNIDIQESCEGIADSGQPIHKYVDKYSNQPAQFNPVRGGEVFRGKTIEANVSAVFDIHFRADIKPKMQVIFRERRYGIEYVHESDGGQRYLELHCKAVADG
jgi:SPP1 family predicted phage head-tail adaptor